MAKLKDGFYKLTASSVGSNNYALLGGGSQIAIGNASGNVPISNGTLNTNLNADLLDGLHSDSFVTIQHLKHTSDKLLSKRGSLVGMSNKGDDSAQSECPTVYGGYVSVNSSTSAGSSLLIYGDTSANNNGLYYRTRQAGSTHTTYRDWRRILDESNYSTFLDSRYYTESEIDTKLLDYLLASNAVLKYTYNITANKVVRISFPATYYNAIVFCRGSIGGAHLILTGTGYGVDRARNLWTQLSKLNDLKWSIPNNGSYPCSIEILGYPTHSVQTVVYSTATPTFTLVDSFTSDAMNDPVVTLGDLKSYYWANIPLQSGSDSTTKPTFGGLTVNGTSSLNGLTEIGGSYKEALSIIRNDSSVGNSVISFKNTSKTIGSIGVSGSGDPIGEGHPVFCDSEVSYKMWHAGNDGSGSGLDADKLDGRHASEFMYFLTSTNCLSASFSDIALSQKAKDTYIEFWDSPGWFNSCWGYVKAINGFRGNLTGTADVATKLAIARKLWGQSFDGMKDIDGTVLSNTSKTKYECNYDTYYLATKFLANDLVGGDSIEYVIGRKYELKNIGYFGYHQGSTDDKTYIRIGFHSVDDILNITTSGNVGIGTTTPSAKLHVNGLILQNQKNTWLNSAVLQIGRTNTTVVSDRAVIGVTNGNLHLDAYNNFGIYLNYYQGTTASADRAVIIAGDGKVGIGTAPSHKLSVNGGYIHITANNRYLTLGPKNEYYCHYDTDAAQGHWFNTTVRVLGNVVPYGNATYNLGETASAWNSVYAVTIQNPIDSGVLTLKAPAAIYFKVNNADATSLVLNTTLFKPFNTANGVFDLGSSAAKWNGVYANKFYGTDFTSTGNGTGTYNIGYVGQTTSDFLIEGALKTDSVSGDRLPITLTWRGGYVNKGGLKITGESTALLGSHTVLHTGNYSSYSPKSVIWNATTTVKAWSRILTISSYCNVFLSICFSLNSQASLHLYLINTGFGTATISQLGYNNYYHANYSAKVRVTQSNNTTFHVEVYNYYGYNGATTVSFACRATVLDNSCTLTPISAYTAGSGAIHSEVTSSYNVAANFNADAVDGLHASDFVKVAGDTMKGTLVVKTGSSKVGLKFGDSYLNSLNNQLIWQTSEAIRFGSTEWNWNEWAGLKYTHSNKTIYLGIADGNTFNANTALSGGSLRFPGISNVYATTFNGNLSGNASTATYCANYGTSSAYVSYDLSTNNTTDTWVPVMNNGKLQHRVIPVAYNNAPSTLSVKYATSAGNADTVDGYHATRLVTFAGDGNQNTDVAGIRVIGITGGGSGNLGNGYGACLLLCNDAGLTQKPSGNAADNNWYSLLIFTTDNRVRARFRTNGSAWSAQYKLLYESDYIGYRFNEGEKTLISGTRTDGTYPRKIYDNGWGLVYYDAVSGANSYIATINSTVANATNATNATNINVYQHTTNDVEYPLIWTNLSNSNSALANLLYKSYNHLMYNPSAKRLTAGYFKGQYLMVYGTDGSTNIGYIGRGSGANNTIHFGGYSGSPIHLFSNGVQENCIYLNTSGNVGIGTTSPSYKLHVNGSFKSTSAIIGGTTGGSGSALLICSSLTSGTGVGTAAIYAGAYGRTSTNFAIYAEGKISTTGGVVNHSDRRLKYDILELSNQDSLVKQMDKISLVSYKTIDGHELRYGMIAQDVMPYFPETVYYNDATGMYSIDYNSLLILKIANLERKIKILEEKLALLI